MAIAAHPAAPARPALAHAASSSPPSSSPAAERHPGRSGKSGFPPAYRKLPPARKLEWLDGPEALALVARRVLHFNQLDAERRRIELARKAVRATAPTPALVDDWARGQAFPPVADDPACAVRRADHVVDEASERRTLWPPYYLVSDSRRNGLKGVITYERALVITEGWRGKEEDPARVRGFFTTDSVSAQAIQAAEKLRATIVSTLHPKFDLETEDVEALRQAIERYAAAVGAKTVRAIVV